jgi:tetratricopeptide (TPR) repeat protein
LTDATGANLLAAAYQAHKDGREADAEALYLRVLEGPPAGHGQAGQMLGLLYLHQGDRHHTLGRGAEAVERYDRVLALAPRGDAYNNRGVALEALGRLDEALDSFSRALACRPDYAAAVFNRGGVLSALGRWPEALADYDRAVALVPDRFAAYWNNRGLALGELNRWAEAADSFLKALSLDPAYADALANLSVAQRRLGQFDAALASADHALSLQPDRPEVLTTRGLALAALGRYEAALESHEQALALRPDYLQALNNAGVALDALDRTDEALARFDAALTLDPGFAEAEYNSALALLRAGRWLEGWRRHEARWRRKGEPGPTYPDETLWLGGADAQALEGLTVLLHAEQGLGDTLQFCRYGPAVKALGARVILEVQPPLKTLLAGLKGVDQIIGVGEPVPPFDRHTPLLSLPLALSPPPPPAHPRESGDPGLSRLAGSEQVPRSSQPRPASKVWLPAFAGMSGGNLFPQPPYLVADLSRAAVWRTHLPPPEGPRIGLVWSGNAAHGNDHNRSLPAEALTPLIAAAQKSGAQMISLQKEVRAVDVGWLERTPDVLRVEAELTDFAETAALIATCDLVISVDTSVAHLAGALGRPLWLLLPKPCDWRWMSNRDDTPWYPGARLFRQAEPGDWAEVLDRAAQALAGWGPA